MEQRAANPYVSRLTEYQVVDIRIIIVNSLAYLIVFHIKIAVNWIFITERRLMFVFHILYYNLYIHTDLYVG